MSTTRRANVLLWLTLVCIDCIYAYGAANLNIEHTPEEKRLIWGVIGSVCLLCTFFCLVWCFGSIIIGACKANCPGFCAAKEDTGEIEEGKVWCYLCCKMMPQEKWSLEGHRAECARVNSSKLNRLTPCNRQKCPVCEESMKFCEVDGKVFSCVNNARCRNNGITKNDSTHARVSCFKCDVNFCQSCTLPKRREPTQPQDWCYLCGKMLPEEDLADLNWSWDEHREKCARINSSKLDRLATCDYAKCPVCEESMKFCEVDGKWFVCANNTECPGLGSALNNTMEKRISCFKCDVNYCGGCLGTSGAGPDISRRENESNNIHNTVPSAPDESGLNDLDNPHMSLLPPSDNGNCPPCYEDAVTAEGYDLRRKK